MWKGAAEGRGGGLQSARTGKERGMSNPPTKGINQREANLVIFSKTRRHYVGGRACPEEARSSSAHS